MSQSLALSHLGVIRYLKKNIKTGLVFVLVLSFSLYKVCLEAARYSTTSHIVMLFLAGHTRETENVLSFQYTPTFLCIDDEMRYFPCCRREKQQLA